METQIRTYKHYENSVGNNLQTIQITTKYRYAMMQKELIETYCKVAIQEACKKHKIEIIILEVLKEHVHLITNCPRTLSQAEMMQIIKGLSAYIIFRLCPIAKDTDNSPVVPLLDRGRHKSFEELFMSYTII